EVIVADPTFGEYAYATQLMGAKLVKVKGAGLGHDLDKMAAAVTERTKAIFVCNPNNPTGTMNTRAELEAFITRIPPEVLIIIDQARSEERRVGKEIRGWWAGRAGQNCAKIESDGSRRTRDAEV